MPWARIAPEYRIRILCYDAQSIPQGEGTPYPMVVPTSILFPFCLSAYCAARWRLLPISWQ